MSGKRPEPPRVLRLEQDRRREWRREWRVIFWRAALGMAVLWLVVLVVYEVSS